MSCPAWKNVFQVSEVPLDWLSWLANADSLTKALEDASGVACQVAVQQEGWGKPWQSESEHLEASDDFWIREVVISTRRPAIFARTIFPKILVERFPAIAQLGNTSLGRTLFADNRFQRGPIEVAEITATHALWQHMPERCRVARCWARRSVFISDVGSLLISEVFLPYVATL